MSFEALQNVTTSGLTNSVPITPLTQGCGGGLYEAWAHLLVTSPGLTGTVQANLEWSNGVTASNSGCSSTPALSLTQVGEQGSCLGCFLAAPGTAISYSTTVTAATGSAVYSLRIRLLYLG
jgi:hypothetical protein